MIKRLIDVSTGSGRAVINGKTVAELNAAVIQAHINNSLQQTCGVHLFASLPSTNAWLMQYRADQWADQWATPQLCITETQTAGRGRRGKSWQSPPGGVTFSLLRRFTCSGAQLACLSLVTACAVITALETLGVRGLSVKWPNDILHHNKKLCGLLIELCTVGKAGVDTVTGIGLNYRGVGNPAGIEQAFTDLAQLLVNDSGDNSGNSSGNNPVGKLPGRNSVIAILAIEVLRAYSRYEQQGFTAFRAQWEKYDACFNHNIAVLAADGQVIDGIARGVADNGALNVETASGLRPFYSGEISVRLQP